MLVRRRSRRSRVRYSSFRYTRDNRPVPDPVPVRRRRTHRSPARIRAARLTHHRGSNPAASGRRSAPCIRRRRPCRGSSKGASAPDAGRSPGRRDRCKRARAVPGVRVPHSRWRPCSRRRIRTRPRSRLLLRIRSRCRRRSQCRTSRSRAPVARTGIERRRTGSGRDGPRSPYRRYRAPRGRPRRRCRRWGRSTALAWARRKWPRSRSDRNTPGLGRRPPDNIRVAPRIAGSRRSPPRPARRGHSTAAALAALGRRSRPSSTGCGTDRILPRSPAARTIPRSGARGIARSR